MEKFPVYRCTLSGNQQPRYLQNGWNSEPRGNMCRIEFIGSFWFVEVIRYTCVIVSKLSLHFCDLLKSFVTLLWFVEVVTLCENVYACKFKVAADGLKRGGIE